MGKLEELAEKIHDEDVREEFLRRVASMNAAEYKEAEAIIPGMFKAMYADKHLGPGNEPIEARPLADTRADGAAATRRRKQMERDRA